MLQVSHKFKHIMPSADTEILILGTFVAETEVETDFYYGRSRNYLWHLLPICWSEKSLKDAALSEKLNFMQRYKIGFADLIDSLEVSEGEETNSDDTFTDNHVYRWNDVIGLISSLKNLKAIYFTKKTFNGIPNIKVQVGALAAYCKQRGIRICKLETPARHFSDEKQQQWIDTIIRQKTCLKA